MRLDHLLSKEERSREACVIYCLIMSVLKDTKLFGGDALGGNTRSHPEHDG